MVGSPAGADGTPRATGGPPVTVALLLGALVVSVVLHEVAHAAVALGFGDDTARRAGRLSLNPVRHVDPFGTVLLPLLLAVTSGTVFGWARPVPVDTARLRRPRDHALLVSLAGPAVNVALALLAAELLRAVAPGSAPDDLAVQASAALGVVNVVLAGFNLLPIPPLDGSAVVERLLPPRLLPGWHRLRRYSMLVVLGVVLLLPGVLDRVFDAVLELWWRWLTR